MNCDQCAACMIQGVFCHETGCPNAKKTWVEGEGWVLFLECRECGEEVREGDMCPCCYPVPDESEEEQRYDFLNDLDEEDEP